METTVMQESAGHTRDYDGLCSPLEDPIGYPWNEIPALCTLVRDNSVLNVGLCFHWKELVVEALPSAHVRTDG